MSKRMTKRAKRQNRNQEETRHFQPPKFSPRNDKQAHCWDLITSCEQVFITGPEGTGKTYLPSFAAGDMLRNKLVSKIVLTKPFVTSSSKSGFIPGGIAEKAEPWLAELRQTISERIGGKHAWDTMLGMGIIEIVPFEYMRGRSFKDTFIILDEAQNATPHEMRMFLTRMGEDSRCIVVGDDKGQKDIKGLSGLTVAIEAIERGAVSVPLVRFDNTDIVRSEMTRAWAEAFDKLLT